MSLNLVQNSVQTADRRVLACRDFGLSSRGRFRFFHLQLALLYNDFNFELSQRGVSIFISPKSGSLQICFEFCRRGGRRPGV